MVTTITNQYVLGERLSICPEPGNNCDKHAVSVMKYGGIVSARARLSKLFSLVRCMRLIMGGTCQKYVLNSGYALNNDMRLTTDVYGTQLQVLPLAHTCIMKGGSVKGTLT